MSTHDAAQGIAGPFLDRRVTLSFQGDWGQANLHRICGWLAQEVGDRSAAGSRFAIWNGRGGTDALRAVLTGSVDVALMTPTAAMGLLTGSPDSWDLSGVESLRALGTLPQRDRLVTCVDADLGVTDLGELAGVLPSLRIATSPDDGVNLIGAAAHRMLSAAGVPADAIWTAGGSFSYSERPFPAVAAFRDGTANVLIHEAIMMPAWQRITEHKRVTFLDVDDSVERTFADWQWPTAVVPAGYLPTLERDLTSLEFSDFLVVCRDDMPDDVAGLIAWCMVATRDALEVQYRHIPPDHSPLTYPLDPIAMARAPIPLHPAAVSTFARLGGAKAADALMWD